MRREMPKGEAGGKVLFCAEHIVNPHPNLKLRERKKKITDDESTPVEVEAELMLQYIHKRQKPPIPKNSKIPSNKHASPYRALTAPVPSERVANAIKQSQRPPLECPFPPTRAVYPPTRFTSAPPLRFKDGEKERGKTHRLKDHLDHQRAARTHGDILAVAQVVDGNLETVATGTRVVIYLQRGIKDHVFDLDLVVNRVGHVEYNSFGGVEDGEGEGGVDKWMRLNQHLTQPHRD